MMRVVTAILLLLTATSWAGQEPNPNVRFGMPAPAKADPNTEPRSVPYRPATVRIELRRQDTHAQLG
jgi:hypothetical protein